MRWIEETGIPNFRWIQDVRPVTGTLAEEEYNKLKQEVRKHVTTSDGKVRFLEVTYASGNKRILLNTPGKAKRVEKDLAVQADAALKHEKTYEMREMSQTKGMRASILSALSLGVGTGILETGAEIIEGAIPLLTNSTLDTIEKVLATGAVAATIAVICLNNVLAETKATIAEMEKMKFIGENKDVLDSINRNPASLALVKSRLKMKLWGEVPLGYLSLAAINQEDIEVALGWQITEDYLEQHGYESVPAHLVSDLQYDEEQRYQQPQYQKRKGQRTPFTSKKR